MEPAAVSQREHTINSQASLWNPVKLAYPSDTEKAGAEKGLEHAGQITLQHYRLH